MPTGDPDFLTPQRVLEVVTKALSSRYDVKTYEVVEPRPSHVRQNPWQRELDLRSGTCPVCRSRVDPEVVTTEQHPGLIGSPSAPIRHVGDYVCTGPACGLVFRRRPGVEWVGDVLEPSDAP
jgi:hypothetical protein